MAATMRSFARLHGIRAASRWADDNPNMDDMPAGSSHWRVTLRNKARRQLTIAYSMGPAHTSEPDALDVLDCLASDANGFENARGFEDWASEYGFDPDSRKAERTYRAIERQTAGLRRFLGDSAFDGLLWHTERL